MGSFGPLIIQISVPPFSKRTLKDHQAKLEQSYWENDVLFNMKDIDGKTPE